jgi:hypothetical protein
VGDGGQIAAILRWYTDRANERESGAVVAEGIGPKLAKALVRQLRQAAGSLEEQLEWHRDQLEDGHHAAEGLRASRRLSAHDREHLAWLENEQPASIIEEAAWDGFAAGLTLGILGARLGFEPALGDAVRGAEGKRQHTKGGHDRHGGPAGDAWRAGRAKWVRKEDKKARKDHPRWVQETRWQKIADAWNMALEQALASGRAAPVPPRVKGTLTWYNVKAILEDARNTS